jgi:hypothetical protein
MSIPFFTFCDYAVKEVLKRVEHLSLPANQKSFRGIGEAEDNLLVSHFYRDGCLNLHQMQDFFERFTRLDREFSRGGMRFCR